MSLIFISHSSDDNFESIALHDWLQNQGWSELFLDIDPERGIAAGERWERALYDAAHRCDAVLFLVSKAWLASEWCRREFRLAQRLNKRIFGALIDDISPAELPDELTSTWQLVELAGGTDHEILRAVHPFTGEERHASFSRGGLTRLRAGLLKAGLDPKFFEWPPADDPDRPPYRGMKPLEAEDAGIFFGREAPTIDLLAQLRGLRDGPPPKLLVILGASGAGKSSFMRAGVLPRLARDDRNFLPLPVLRPGSAALWGDAGLMRVLADAFSKAGMKVTQGAVREALAKALKDPASVDVLGGWFDELVALGTSAALPGEAPVTPSLVLPIDQGEELFASEGRDEAEACLKLIRLFAERSESPLIVMFTIRSDSYDYLQTSRALEGLPQHTFSLMPMPAGAYHSIIEGPAARLASSDRPLSIDPALTETLMRDIDQGGSKDALPLLAFTLERLYLEYGGDGDLTLDEYKAMGGVEGAISAAAEVVFEMARSDPKLPDDRGALELLVRRALVPWLAGIDPDTHAPRRRVARLREIPAEAQPVIRHLVQQRLLSTDVNQDGETTVEPTHEALLRQWGLLKGWLEEDFAALSVLDALQRASRDWLANDRDDDWLNHSAGRLEDAERLNARDDLASFLGTDDRAYLAACREAENERRERALREAQRLAKAREKEAAAQKRVAARTRAGLAVASALTVVAVVLGLQALSQQEKAVASQAELLLNASIETAATGQAGQSVASLLEALELEPGNRAAMGRLVSLLTQRAFPVHKATFDLFDGEVRRVFKSPDGALLVVLSAQDEAAIFDVANGTAWAALGRSDHVANVAFSADDRWLALVTTAGEIQVWDRESGALEHRIEDGPWPAGLALSADGSYVAGQHVWDLGGDEPAVRSVLPRLDGVVNLHWEDRQAGVITVLRNGRVIYWPLTDSTIARMGWHGRLPARISQSRLSADGRYLFTASDDAKVQAWDRASGEIVQSIELANQVSALEIEGGTLYCATISGELYEWDVESAIPTSERHLHDGSISDLDFQSGTLLSASWDGTARLHTTTLPRDEPMLHDTTVIAVVAGADDGEVYTLTSEGALRRWRFDRPEFRFETMQSMEDISRVAHDRSLGQVAMVAGENRRLFVNDLVDRSRQVFTSATPVIHLGMNPAGDELRWITAGGRLNRASRQDGAWQQGESLELDDRAVRVVPTGAWDTAILEFGNGELQYWDIASGVPVGFRMATPGRIVDLAHLDGAGLFAAIVRAGGRQYLEFWDAPSGIPYGDRHEVPADTRTIAYRQGRLFLAAAQDVYVVSLGGEYRPGAEAPTLSPEAPLRHSEEIIAVEYSDDGTTVATSTLDGILRVWDSRSATEKVEPVNLGSAGYTLDISSNGSWLAIGSQDGSVRAIDIEHGIEVADSYSHPAPVMYIGFDEVGNGLISASVDGTTRVTETGLHLADDFPDWLSAFAHAIVHGDLERAAAVANPGGGSWQRWRSAFDTEKAEQTL